jgi:hypothetical protein
VKSRVWQTLWLVVLLAVAFAGGARAADQGEEVPVWRYTVRPADTLIGIAERYLSKPWQWPLIQRANKVDDPYRMLPGTVLRIPATMLRRAPAEATIATVSGEARWRAADGEWQPAVNGQRLASGSTLETLDDASVLLRLADGSKLLLSPNSRMVLDSLSVYADGLMVDARLRLQGGQTEVTADPDRRNNRHIQIQTPSAQAVVRGTRFRVGVEGDVSREETLRGRVGVSAAGRSVSVRRGQGTIARLGEPPIKPVPLLPAPDAASFPARFEQLPLRFPVPHLTGAVAWYGEIAPDPSFDRLLLSRTARGAALTFADLPNGEYVLRLRAADVNGLHGREVRHRFVVFARPFSPGLNSPGDAATIRVAQPVFAWSKLVDVARYRLQLASEPEFAQPLHDASSEQNTWQVPMDLPAGPLYWRVASIDSAGQQGPWRPAAGFTYKPAPGAVDLGRSAIEILAETIELRLPQAPDGMTHEAILSSAADLVPVLAQAQASDGALSLPRPDGGSYYLGVRLVDSGDNTPGPATVQELDVPYSRLWLLLLLLPLAVL